MIFVLKVTKKYTHNMILMSRYKGQLHGGKRAKKFGQGTAHPHPLLGQCLKENVIFGRCSLIKQIPFLKLNEKQHL